MDTFVSNIGIMDIYKSIASLVFPSELLDHFEVVKMEECFNGEEKSVIFYLEELDKLNNIEKGHEYEKNGFYEASLIRDFPLRDRKVTLSVKRRRWINKTTGKSVSNDYKLTAEGTRSKNCRILGISNYYSYFCIVITWGDNDTF